jgi:hypothetical protein
MPEPERLVPDEVIPHKTLPPLRYRDLPEAPHWTKLVGPSVILAGLALGSGEFVFWPYITYKSGFVFFWACMLGVITQYFINMEIERWTLATGESAITGFCRLSRIWAPVMLALNVIPWIWPGWATGAASMFSWLVFGAVETPVTVQQPLPAHVSVELPASLKGSASIEADKNGVRRLQWTGPMTGEQRFELSALGLDEAWLEAVAAISKQVEKSHGVKFGARYVPWIAIATLVVIGLVLTSSPVVYNTVEKMQVWLVCTIFVIAVMLGILFIRPHAVSAMFAGMTSIGDMPPESSGLELMALLGALAFAGAGGTMNLGQSNFIKDKGYGMGRYIGRITSPLTGNEEAVADVGFHFPHTPENMTRWRAWWRAANIEHFATFFMTCLVCLMLLSLLSYSLFYDAAGTLKPGMERFGDGNPVQNAVFRDGNGAIADDGTRRPRCHDPHLYRHHQNQLPAQQRVLDAVAAVFRAALVRNRRRRGHLAGRRIRSELRATAVSAENVRRDERRRDVHLLGDSAVPEQQDPHPQPVDDTPALRGDRLVLRVLRLFHLPGAQDGNRPVPQKPSKVIHSLPRVDSASIGSPEILLQTHLEHIFIAPAPRGNQARWTR